MAAMIIKVMVAVIADRDAAAAGGGGGGDSV